MSKTKLIEAADKLASKGLLDKAIKELERAREGGEFDLRVLKRLADLYSKKKDFQAATPLYREIARFYARDGFFSKAIAVYKQILQFDSETERLELIQIHESLGELYHQLGLSSDAIGHYQVVLGFYDRNGMKKEFFDVLKKVADLDPSNVDNQLKYAELCIIEGRTGEGESLIDSLATEYRDAQDTPNLIRVLEIAVRHPIKNQLALGLELSKIQCGTGDARRALATLQPLFKRNPKEPRVLEALATAFQALGQHEKARTVWVECARLFRSSENVKRAEEIESQLKAPQVTFAPELIKVESGREGAGDNGNDLTSFFRPDLDSAEDRKIFTEVDVFIKYGLNDKAIETLQSLISKNPKALYGRYLLKKLLVELDRKSEAADQLYCLIKGVAERGASEQIRKALQAELDLLSPNDTRMNSSAPKPTSPVLNAALEEASEAIEVEFEEEGSLPIPESSIEESLVDESSVDLLSNFEVISKPEKGIEPDDEDTEYEVIDLGATESPRPEPKAEEPFLLNENDFDESELAQLDRGLAADSGLSDPGGLALILDEGSQVVESGSAEMTDTVRVPDPSSDRTRIDEGIEEARFFFVNGMVSEARQAIVQLMREYPAHEAKLRAVAVEFGDSELAADGELTSKPDVHPGEFELFESPDAELSKPVVDHQSNAEEVSDPFALVPESESTSDPFAWVPDPEPAHEAKAESFEIQEVNSVPPTPATAELDMRVKFQVAEDNRSDVDSEFMDIAAEIQSELAEEERRQEQENPSLGTILSEFKKNIAANVDENDGQTHFDLGVAYREMGLVDDAIEAFRLSSRQSNLRVQALWSIAVTQSTAGRYAEAETTFKEALALPDLTTEDRLNLLFDRGENFLLSGAVTEAHGCFSEVQAADSAFRDVREKLATLRG